MSLRIPYVLALTLGLVGCGSSQSGTSGAGTSGAGASGAGASGPSKSVNSSTSDTKRVGASTVAATVSPDIVATTTTPVVTAEPVVLNPPISIPNGRLHDGFIVGGLPSRDQIDAALAADIESAMSLMASGEGQGDAIAGYAAGKGFRYLHYAINGIDDLNEASAWEFAATLSMVDKPAIIHSQHGRRVGAIFALMAFFVDELPAQEAYEIGRAAGMGDFSSHVRKLLELPTK